MPLRVVVEPPMNGSISDRYVPIISHIHIIFLVGGLVAIFYFPINIGFLIIPIDEVIFFRGVAQPPTSFGGGGSHCFPDHDFQHEM